jgi:hypothetical protein
MPLFMQVYGGSLRPAAAGADLGDMDKGTARNH